MTFWPSRLPKLGAIAPAPRAVAALVALVPAGLMVAALAPRVWALTPALAGGLLALVLLDGALAGALDDARLLAPAEIELGSGGALTVLADFRGAVRRAEAVLTLDPRLASGGRLALTLAPDADGALSGTARLAASRRCEGAIIAMALRWPGPLGLALRSHRRPLDAAVKVLPDLSPLRAPAIQTLLRDAELGLIARRLRGDGTLFETLAEYQPGMDRRRIDWKVSARHARLFAREYEAERNNRIVFAMDCGQAMCQPVGASMLSRLDRAVTAALTTAWVALKTGDQVALFGFAAQVSLSTPFATGTLGFARLRRAAATLAYEPREPNFTLALASLAARLSRRALVVVFSDFSDPTSASLMVESIARLVSRHRVLFVTMADDELDTIARAAPMNAATLAQSVSAGGLLQARAVVLARLRQMGVDVIEAPCEAIGPRLIDTYLALRQRGEIG